MLENTGFAGPPRPARSQASLVTATHVSPASPVSARMTPTERRASGSLAAIFASRMLGLFLVLPVFALEAARYPGGGDAAMIGLAMGIYGLTQGLLQFPFGLASDRLGRKRVICIGLLLFAAGSFVGAAAPTLGWLIVARALQGVGAVSAAVTALLADLTRDEVRTKAMAMVGASIGLMFALSLVAAPLLAAHIGLSGLFAVTGMLALACIGIVYGWTPPEPALHKNVPRGRLADVLKHAPLLRLDLGVFVLHAVQVAMWVAVPGLLVQAGWTRASTGTSTCRRCWRPSSSWGARCFPWSGAVTCARCSCPASACCCWCRWRCWSWRPIRRSPRLPPCCSSSSAPSTCWRPPSPAWPRGSRRRTPAARRSVCTTPCNPWDFLPAARSAAGS
jgi:MFS family permease